METIAVIDFETTGLSPDQGDRATEIGIVLLQNGQIVDRYQSLINAGIRIPPYIEALTGISNAMIRQAPPPAEVMQAAADFVGDLPLLAHNAAFDSKYWDAELARIGRRREQAFACSLLLARRILPQAPSHRLSNLIEYARLPVAGRYHRALADAEMAASLLHRLQEILGERFALAPNEIPHELLCKIQRQPKAKLDAFMAQHQRSMATNPSASRAPKSEPCLASLDA